METRSKRDYRSGENVSKPSNNCLLRDGAVLEEKNQKTNLAKHTMGK
jgi:hypothetical protein